MKIIARTQQGDMTQGKTEFMLLATADELAQVAGYKSHWDATHQKLDRDNLYIGIGTEVRVSDAWEWLQAIRAMPHKLQVVRREALAIAETAEGMPEIFRQPQEEEDDG